MVASNEFEERSGWMKASLPMPKTDLWSKNTVSSLICLCYTSLVTIPEPLNLETWKYAGADSYSRNVYIRGKLVLKDIERQVGTKAMNNIMSSYARKFRFQHPATSDFQKVVEKVTKKSWQRSISMITFMVMERLTSQ